VQFGSRVCAEGGFPPVHLRSEIAEMHRRPQQATTFARVFKQPHKRHPVHFPHVNIVMYFGSTILRMRMVGGDANTRVHSRSERVCENRWENTPSVRSRCVKRTFNTLIDMVKFAISSAASYTSSNGCNARSSCTVGCRSANQVFGWPLHTFYTLLYCRKLPEMIVRGVRFSAQVSVCQLAFGRPSFDLSQKIAALYLRKRRNTVRRTRRLRCRIFLSKRRHAETLLQRMLLLTMQSGLMATLGRLSMLIALLAQCGTGLIVLPLAYKLAGIQ
jgi:hypothetical protein